MWRRSLRDVLAFAVVAVFSVLYLAESRRSRLELERQAVTLKKHTEEVRRSVDKALLRVSSLGRKVNRGIDSLLAQMSSGPVPAVHADSNGIRESEEEDDEAYDDTASGLPPLPANIHDPVAFVRGLSPGKFFADPEYNPAGKTFSTTERVRVAGEVAIARSRIDILDKEIQMICAENMDWMREEGEYMEYDRGVAPDPADVGVVTFGEKTESGTTRI